MRKQSKIIEKLQRALETESIYRIVRSPNSADDVTGFVVGLGAKWVLIARTGDGGYSDGLAALRIRNVASLTKDRSFETRFALKQPQRSAADLASIDLDSTQRVVETMSDLSRLVCIARDEKVNAAVWIGLYVGKHRKRFGLHEVNPDASWDAEPTGYRFSELTSVTIEDHYMTALAVIAGEPPAPSV